MTFACSATRPRSPDSPPPGCRSSPYRHALPWSRTDAFDDLAVFATFADGGAGRDLDDLLTDWSADAAVIDCLMLGPLQAAQNRGLPTVALFHSFWAFFGERFPHGPITEMAAPHGREPSEALGRGHRGPGGERPGARPGAGRDPAERAVDRRGAARSAPRRAPSGARRRPLSGAPEPEHGVVPRSAGIAPAHPRRGGELPIDVVATIDRNIAADGSESPPTWTHARS